MKKLYCEYCGNRLDGNNLCLEGCHDEANDSFSMEDYENNHEIQYGWAQQDTIDLYRREQ